jgi:DNA-binding transcriptional MocR family regulator
MRLAFSAVSPEQIGEGIARLGALMSSAPAPAGV